MLNGAARTSRIISCSPVEFAGPTNRNIDFVANVFGKNFNKAGKIIENEWIEITGRQPKHDNARSSWRKNARRFIHRFTLFPWNQERTVVEGIGNAGLFSDCDRPRSCDISDMFAISRDKAAFAQTFEHRLSRAQTRFSLFAVRPGIDHHPEQKNFPRNGSGLCVKKIYQGTDVMFFCALAQSAIGDDVCRERGLLFLRDCDWVLPQPRVDILLGNYRDRFFAGHTRSCADERPKLRNNAGEGGDYRQ